MVFDLEVKKGMEVTWIALRRDTVEMQIKYSTDFFKQRCLRPELGKFADLRNTFKEHNV